MFANEFQSYQRFPNSAVAQPLLALLHENGIEAETRLAQPSVDPSFAFNETSRYFLVLLRPADFARAQALEQQAAEAQLTDLPADHYLFAFSNPELYDILLRPDEWSALDGALARQLLAQRDQPVSPALLAELHRQRLTELARPEPRQTAWIVVGYVLALLGGFFGLLLGWHLYAHRRQLPTGEQVPAFSPADRAHGRRMLVLGAVMFLASWGWWLLGGL